MHGAYGPVGHPWGACITYTTMCTQSPRRYVVLWLCAERTCAPAAHRSNKPLQLVAAPLQIDLAFARIDDFSADSICEPWLAISNRPLRRPRPRWRRAWSCGPLDEGACPSPIHPRRQGGALLCEYSACYRCGPITSSSPSTAAVVRYMSRVKENTSPCMSRQRRAEGGLDEGREGPRQQAHSS